MNEAATHLSVVAADLQATSLHRARSRWFFVGAAVFVLSIVFLGFAPTFYLRPLFAPHFPLRPVPLYRYVHGTVMTLWYVLFLIQASLVARGRTHLHRRIGVVAALTAVAASGRSKRKAPSGSKMLRGGEVRLSRSKTRETWTFSPSTITTSVSPDGWPYARSADMPR